MEFVVGWFIFSVVAGVIASSKGRSGFGYFLLSLILSPLIGIILAVAMPKIDPTTAALRAGESKKCPMCAEFIKAEAVKCRYCGADVSAAPKVEGAAYDLGKAVGRVMK